MIENNIYNYSGVSLVADQENGIWESRKSFNSQFSFQYDFNKNEIWVM